MTQLLRAGGLVGLPVVTLAGESPVEVKDVVFDTEAGTLLGFTLRNHGFLGGPVPRALPWTEVHGLGPDAVVIASEEALVPSGQLPAPGGDVLGARVFTEAGREVGAVVEVVLSTGTEAEVVGFELDPSPHLQVGDRTAFIPLPEAAAISDENIVVPEDAVDDVRTDLTAFGGTVDELRSRSGGPR